MYTVVQHTLLTDETATVLLTGTDDVETVTFLVIDGETEIAILGRAVNRDILIQAIAHRTSNLVPPVRIATIVLTTTRTTELLGRKNLWMRLCHVQGNIAVVSHIGDTCRTRSLLCGDEDDTIGATCAVDGSRACILQHSDRLHILGGNIAQVTTGNTVDHDQRTVRGRQ